MFSIPTLPDLVERVRRSMRTQLPGSDAYLWPNNLNPIGKVFAGLIHEVFGFADYIRRQIFVMTADDENLDMHGNEYGLPRLPAAPAQGPVVIAVADAYTINPGAILRLGNGIEYVATSGATTASAATLSIEVTAVANGAAGNAAAGAGLEIVSGAIDPNGDANPQAVVGTGGIVLGADIEGDEDYRSRILVRKRNPPHGGAPADYVTWARQVSGVSRVFVERKFAGAGTVRVFPLMDGLFANGIPDAAAVTRVDDYIQMVAPAGAIVVTSAAAAYSIPVIIANLKPDTPDTRNAAVAELRGAFRRFGRVAGSDVGHAAMPYLASPFTFSLSWLSQAINDAPGVTSHDLLAPTTDIVVPRASIPVPDITFAPVHS
ncbi:baseplate J/gp47 family protein [Bradyrhizobium sp. SZCCHNR3118]|uniref:baseplate J/gp47 family protein n=1 Tax=Bradyrhizobium sp. SZCCHNR3118 TaxID=3057468 RepID=UPI00291684EB|nr:baseplate J/gp47 family protein [Bradyrhizobium sp. SZCCHNR3118]